MRTFIFAIIVSLLSLNALAAEPKCSEESSSEEVAGQLEIKTDVPKHLEGATIIVRLADGRETAVPAERFKVVARKQQFITTRTERRTVLSCKAPSRDHRVSLLGGHGPQGSLKTTSNGITTEVESQVGLVGGAQYQYKLNDRFSVGVQGQTNKTGSVLFGIDF